ncbi:hypothetical protein OPV22_033407 [Ensete ventricosum]|uniref:Uncharacterized protein n=1 Tax=Ensete ventricosum TaxID=4639 RepID=A0AAV8P0W6_ENSVE|nr:hypothetical protein OPV22_033407 [Ensete ventricosum]
MIRLVTCFHLSEEHEHPSLTGTKEGLNPKGEGRKIVRVLSTGNYTSFLLAKLHECHVPYANFNTVCVTSTPLLSSDNDPMNDPQNFKDSYQRPPGAY